MIALILCSFSFAVGIFLGATLQNASEIEAMDREEDDRNIYRNDWGKI